MWKQVNENYVRFVRFCFVFVFILYFFRRNHQLTNKDLRLYTSDDDDDDDDGDDDDDDDERSIYLQTRNN